MLLSESGADEVFITALRIRVNDRVGLAVSVQRKQDCIGHVGFADADDEKMSLLYSW